MAPPVSPAVAHTATGGGRRLILAGFVSAWILFLALPPALLVRSRDAWLADLENPAIQEDWDGFRSDMKAHSGRDGPVQRKVPRSLEPPLRVWLRDHFALAITAWIVLGGTLGAFLGTMILGAVTGPQPWPPPERLPPRRGAAGSDTVAGLQGSLPEHEAGGGGDGREDDQRDSQHTQQ